jgi:surfactin synthase thioesterase subunit
MKNHQVIIGIGGLTAKEEKGRVSKLLDLFQREYQYKTHEIINQCTTRNEKNGKTIITCPVEREIRYLQEAITQSIQQNSSTKIAIITSSMGATQFFEYLSQTQEIPSNIIAHATIAPFTKVNPYASDELKKCLNESRNLDISSSFDKKREISRIIPYGCLDYLLNFDASQLLDRNATKYKIDTLTIMANRDERVDNSTTKKVHQMFEGNTKLIELNSQHCIPYDLIGEDEIVKFITEKTSVSKSAA